MLTELLKLKSSWEVIKETDLPVILYGTGDGADKVLDECNRLSINVSGVMASDDFVRSRSFRGFTVKSLNDFQEKYYDFIIILGFATQREDVIENIINIQKKHQVIVPCAPVYSDDFINRAFIEKHKTDIENLYDILCDEISKEVLLDFLRFELTGDLKYLFRSETPKSEAFRTILRLNNNENYLDLGAYRGDTIDEFLYYAQGNYHSITALEPNYKNYLKLCDYAKGKRNIITLNKGVWNENTFLKFSQGGSRGSATAKDNGETIETVTVDSLQGTDTTTYLKADVEGCEREMLYGGFDTLRKFKPKLNIAAYHKSQDFFRLAFLIKEINPDYKIYLRHHRYIPCWDMNLYCI